MKKVIIAVAGFVLGCAAVMSGAQAQSLPGVFKSNNASVVGSAAHARKVECFSTQVQVTVRNGRTTTFDDAGGAVCTKISGYFQGRGALQSGVSLRWVDYNEIGEAKCMGTLSRIWWASNPTQTPPEDISDNCSIANQFIARSQ